jgi:phage tail-like protein
VTAPATPVSELVQNFRFLVVLTRSAQVASVWQAPPLLAFGTSRTAVARPAGRTAPPLPAGADTVGSGEQLGDGGFQECSGLELDTETADLVEGARNDGVVRRVGRVKLTPIVLKRGMFVPSAGGYCNAELWQWLRGMVSGELPVPRYDGSVRVMDAANRRVVARWSFFRGLPAKITGPALNARSGEIAVEELHIAHEGLRLETTP